MGNSLLLHTVGLGLSKLEQSQISISTEVKKSVDIYCKVSSTNFENDIIHWYQQKQNQALEHLIYVSSTKSPARSNQGGKDNKIEARKNSLSLISMLTINFIEKVDVAIYYCAGWTHATITVETTHTRSPPWICAHPHPSQQWQPQPASCLQLGSWSQPHLTCNTSWALQRAVLDYPCT